MEKQCHVWLPKGTSIGKTTMDTRFKLIKQHVKGCCKSMLGLLALEGSSWICKMIWTLTPQHPIATAIPLANHTWVLLFFGAAPNNLILSKAAQGKILGLNNSSLGTLWCKSQECSSDIYEILLVGSVLCDVLLEPRRHLDGTWSGTAKVQGDGP